MLQKLVLTGLLLAVNSVFAAVVHEEVSYNDNGTNMVGYIAYDDAITAKRPGIVIVHEWWGHNSYARARADKLAAMGYTAFALDMYGDGKTAGHPKEAGAFSGQVKKNPEMMKSRFLAAMKQLQGHKTVDADRIGAIGYCFGGSVVLEMAKQGVDLDLVASFHGALDSISDAKASAIKGEVLVANGAADKFIKPESIAAFNKEMAEAQVNYRFINYPDSVHAFTNPEADELGSKFGIPLAYNAMADAQSWFELEVMLQRVFP